MSDKRSDSATAADCDWSFLGRPEVMEAIEGLVRTADFRRQGDPDDIRQELYLYLGVRPELQAKEVDLIAMSLYSRIRDLGKAYANVVAHELPYVEGWDSDE